MTTEDNFGVEYEMLALGQNITDQPPFRWIMEDQTIVPREFFRDMPHAYMYFLRAVVLHHPWNIEEMDIVCAESAVRQAYTVINKEYKPSIAYSAQRLFDAVSAYPLALEYLRAFWSFTTMYRANGTPKRTDETDLSYVGYLDFAMRMKQISQWNGLEDILPDSSAVTDIESALPAKGHMNRQFRIRKSEALK